MDNKEAANNQQDNLTDSGKMRQEILRLVHEELERFGVKLQVHEEHIEKRIEDMTVTIDFTKEQLKQWNEYRAEQEAKNAPKQDLFESFVSGLGQFFAEWQRRKDARKKK